ncbi:MAG: hypothetical protein Q7R87_03035 [Nanoarchaeota archaeon]|nr:hypothetical protein [Nanoarchaeota archaeon]
MSNGQFYLSLSVLSLKSGLRHDPFSRSNETLRIIVKGLDIQPEDRVLSICGSGDQPIAFLSQGARVLAVDTYQDQITFAKRRINLLRKGLLNKFLEFPREDEDFKVIWGRNNSFFRRELELENLDFRRLKFTKGDIFSLDPEIYRGFNKVYLSNAWPIRPNNTLRNFAENLPEGCLVYSNSDNTMCRLRDTKLMERQQPQEYNAIRKYKSNWPIYLLRKK